MSYFWRLSWPNTIVANTLILVMKQLNLTSIAYNWPRKQEIINLFKKENISRRRHGFVMVCILFFATYMVGIILNPLCKFSSLSTTIDESRGLYNSTKKMNDDNFPLVKPCFLNFMNEKTIILVSHELSLSGGPLLLMEFGSILQRSGAFVFWITIHKKKATSPLVVFLEKKLLNYGIKVVAARRAKIAKALTMADLVILNTLVAGKWISTLRDAQVPNVLSKTLWWIHEMRGHYFEMDCVKYLPKVVGIIIDSHTAANYWKMRTKYRLRLSLPKIYVVHLGNSQQLMLAAKDDSKRYILRQHVRYMAGIQDDDTVFGMINSVSRGKGQDKFLRAFLEGVNLTKHIVQKKRVNTMHAFLVGSDWTAPSYELMLRNFVNYNGLESKVHFVNKSLDVDAYLAAFDVLIQNSQGQGECFGRITIEAMAFQLPILGTEAGGTPEIVVSGITGRLHPVGKEGVHALAQNIRDLALNKSLRIEMGGKGYNLVQQHFMECHMCERLGLVLQTIFSKLFVQHNSTR